MVNQKYVSNECEKMIDKKGVNENAVYFSKFFGENAFCKMLDLIKLKAKGQKVLMIVNAKEYQKYTNFKSDDFDSVILSSKSVDYDMLCGYTKTFDETIKCIIAIGGDDEVSIAKYLAKEKNLDLILYINQFASLDSFLPFSYNYKNGIMQKFDTKNYDYLYIDSSELLANTTREKLCDMVFNCISKLGFLFEKYIDCCFVKDNGYNKYVSDYLGAFNELNKILNNAIDLKSDDILKLMDINLEFSHLLLQMGYGGIDNENEFSFVYKYLNKNSNLTYNSLKAIGVQVILKLYNDFICKLKYIPNSYFDIEKRIQLFDSTLKFADLEFDIGEVVSPKQIYMLCRFQDKICVRLASINKMVDQLMYKTLDLYSDSGYIFINSVDKDCVLKSIYFIADLKDNKTLLKTMRNIGVLDFYS